MTSADVAALVLRLGLGMTLCYHGYAKAVLGGRIPGLVGWFSGMRMRAPRLNAYAAVGTEVGGGSMMAAGLLTPLAAGAFVGIMFVAAWTSHRAKGFLITKGGWEYTLVLAVAAAAVAALGPGRWSVDHALGLQPLVAWRGLAFASVLGLVVAFAQLAAFYRPADAPARPSDAAGDSMRVVDGEGTRESADR